MLTLVALAGTLLGAPDPLGAMILPSAAPIAQVKSGKRVLSVLSTWLKIYRKGKWDLTAGNSRGRGGFGGGFGGGGRRGGSTKAPKRPTSDDDLVVKNNLLPDDHATGMNYRTENGVLCRLAREPGTVEATRAVLEVAAVGLDARVRYTSKMAPTIVR